MKTIDQLIQEKRQQVERLNAQLEVLEELAGEGNEGAPGRRPGRPVGGGRRRARRGVNQRKVLKILGSSPMRARDIAASAKLSPGAVNQVLMMLKKRRMVEQAGRGLYKLAARPSAPTRSAAARVSKPKARRRRKPSGKSRKSPSKAPKAPSRQEAAPVPAEA